MSSMQLDCGACKTEPSMKATKIPRFNIILRIVGFIIAIPSVLGVLFSIIMLFTTGQATSKVMSTAQSDAETAGAANGATMGFGISIFIGASSLVGGTIDYLLLMKRKVYKCLKCGYILDRA